ncbi:hypothetical protein F2J48_21375 [Salmonella enterica subsp. enterica]|uniref:Uncharacterized protein n=1 Tax=Salmonella enterica subsp. enterica serovar Telelkebir TaxID=1967657 RepID=A0A610C572_SALET|nr:hypothetical protein [Salmonella enterica subsp. enterica serovar Telelkebir]
MTNNRPDLVACMEEAKRHHMMRFTCGAQTAQHQVNRVLEFAKEGNWLIALEFLDVATRTISSLKRVAREVTPAVNEEKQS